MQDMIYKRKSVRKYRPDCVDEGTGRHEPYRHGHCSGPHVCGQHRHI